MAEGSPRVQQNYLAIVVAAIVCFLFEAAWYQYFLDRWLGGIGHNREWLMTSGVNPALQFATALLAEALLAGAISWVTQMSGAQTARRGVQVAILLWTGCVLTTLATEYSFEIRSYSLFAINAGFWLIGMMLMGAIVGGWKKKTA